jgi:hypothetical protein
MQTVERILERGCSIARFGDGEITIAVCGGGAPGQDYDPGLAAALRKTAATNIKKLVVAIPRIFEYIPPEKHRWTRWLQPSRCVMWDTGRKYGSAFISRPDFYGQPFGREYWDKMREIWDNRDVLLVRGDDKVPRLFHNAGSIEPVQAPNRNAWAAYHRVLDQCLSWAADNPEGLVLAQLGPTATVLAHDLCIRGVQCLDLGKADRFYRDEMLGEVA